MATIRIKPSGNQWVVTKNGGTVKNHRKKSTAKQTANRVANSGDNIVEHGRGGQILNQRRRR
ncbi:MAG: DUF2188 domain-containing protein [Natronomonas sp.]|nr:DUF2188 domain-containing protein [Natronomonas sp.]